MTAGFPAICFSEAMWTNLPRQSIRAPKLLTPESTNGITILLLDLRYNRMPGAFVLLSRVYYKSPTSSKFTHACSKDMTRLGFAVYFCHVYVVLLGM
jgi:hypothetical protein